MAKTIENLFFYLVYVFDFFIIVQALLLLTKPVKKNIPLLLFSYCLLNSSCNLLQTELPENFGYPLLVFFTICEYFILSIIFHLIIKNKVFKKLILIFSVIFFIVVTWNYNIGKSHNIDSLPIGIETILIIVYSFYFLFEQMNIVDVSFIYSRATFWIVLGGLIYLSGSFFIYIFANQASNDEALNELLDNYWFLTYAFYIIKNIFFSIGLFIYAKPQKKTSSLIHKLTPI